jgi:hypothetical protein
MTPLREWFKRGAGPATWIPKSKEAWALTAAIVAIGVLIGRIA